MADFPWTAYIAEIKLKCIFIWSFTAHEIVISYHIGCNRCHICSKDLNTISCIYSSLSTFSDPDKFDDDDDDEETKFEENQPRVYRLLVATYYVLIARSELVCYFLMILNHILTASLLSLPLPIFVFLWGMLSVPRPTKMFWITVITYTEVKLDFNPCHAEYFYVLHSFPIFILLICSIPATVKPVLNGHSKIDKTMILITKVSLMQVKSIAECSKGHSAIHLACNKAIICLEN